RAESRRQVGSRNAKAVIVPGVDNHVGADRHVTGRAGERRICTFMAAVSCGRILPGRMALQAHAIAGNTKRWTMRLLAVAAGDAGGVHLALFERAIGIDLIEHLPISMIEPLRERLDEVRVGKPPAWNPGLGKFAASRVAQATGLDLPAEQSGRVIPGAIARA